MQSLTLKELLAIPEFVQSARVETAAECHRRFATWDGRTVGYTTVKCAVNLLRAQGDTLEEKTRQETQVLKDFTTDKKIASFHWKEAIPVLEQMQALSDSASNNQDTAEIDFSQATAPIMVTPQSDWHIGSWGTSYKDILETTELIINTPNLYVAFLGDMLQMAIKMRGVLEMMDNALTPKMQMRFLETWLKDIEHKVLFSCWDNHAVVREENAAGLSQYAEIFSRRVVYHNHIGYPTITVGSRSYALAVSHRFQGRSMYNPVHAQQRFLRMEAPDKDLCIQGDTHVPGFMQYFEGGRQKTVLNCGTLQTNSGYAKRYYSLKAWPEFPCFVLHHDRQEVVPFMKVATMIERYGRS